MSPAMLIVMTALILIQFWPLINATFRDIKNTLLAHKRNWIIMREGRKL